MGSELHIGCLMWPTMFFLISALNCTVYFIIGLPFYTSEKTLRAEFEGFGELDKVNSCICFPQFTSFIETIGSRTIFPLWEMLKICWGTLVIFIVFAVKIIMDEFSKRSKEYAFIKYTTVEAATAALREMNGKVRKSLFWSLHNLCRTI